MAISREKCILCGKRIEGFGICEDCKAKNKPNELQFKVALRLALSDKCFCLDCPIDLSKHKCSETVECFKFREKKILAEANKIIGGGE